MTTTSRRLLQRLATACAGIALLCAGPMAAASPTADVGEVFVLHGLPGVTADVLVDGEVVEAGAEAQTVVGPLSLAAGEHTIALEPTTGLSDALSAMVTVEAGASIDVIAHQTADPTAAPTVTVYPNDLSPVAPGKTRLVVAHTAAVPPADIRVNGEVLFSNVANGEALTLLVPSGTYSVDIVPTGTSGPAVFGPVDLPVAAAQLTRVFALGDPAQGTMDVVVQTLPLPVQGAAPPGSVDTGDGGQAAAKAQSRAENGFLAARTTSVLPLRVAISGLGAFVLVGAATGLARRRRAHS